MFDLSEPQKAARRNHRATRASPVATSAENFSWVSAQARSAKGWIIAGLVQLRLTFRKFIICTIIMLHDHDIGLLLLS
jgi:hypothetical protein